MVRDGAAGLTFDQSQAAEIRTLWVRRIWRFFSDKFDQRATKSSWRDLLLAADEVVWSCFHEARVQTSGGMAGQAAPPLAYVEPKFAPVAIPPLEQFLSEEVRDLDSGQIASILKNLPIPLLRLPPAYLTNPWSPVLLGHEVGHHIQFGLLPNQGLVDSYKTLVQDTVRGLSAAAGNPLALAVAGEWGGWSLELFADAISVPMMGPAAVGAMGYLDWHAAPGRLARRGSYPPSTVRLAFLKGLADELGFSPLPDFPEPGYDPATDAAANFAAARDIGFARTVAKASLGAIPGLDPTLTKLARFEVSDLQTDTAGYPGRVLNWVGELLAAQGNPTPRTNVLAAAASWLAWSELRRRVSQVAGPNPTPAAWQTLMNQFDQEARQLGGRSLTLLASRRPEGTRAAPAAVQPSPDWGRQLGESLLQIPDSQLARSVADDAV